VLSSLSWPTQEVCQCAAGLELSHDRLCVGYLYSVE